MDSHRMMTFHDALRAHPACPVCGGSKRQEAKFEASERGFYAATLIKQLGIDEETYANAMTLFQCGNCRTLWHDPWLAPEVSGALYGYLAGRHKYGWAAFRAWLLGGERSYFFARPRIWELLEALSPELKNYGEVNCPFGGLFFLLFDAVTDDFDRKRMAEKIHSLSCMYTPKTLDRAYGETVSFTDLIRDIQAARNRADRPRTFLIREFTDMGWHHSCIFNGNNCTALAQDVLIDRVVAFETLLDEGIKLDAIGFFNTWDHFRDPMRVLAKALDVANVVVIDLHRYDWTDAQHFFNVGDRIVPVLRQQGLNALDITRHVTENASHGDDRRYLLVSREVDLDALLVDASYVV